MQMMGWFRKHFSQFFFIVKIHKLVTKGNNVITLLVNIESV